MVQRHILSAMTDPLRQPTFFIGMGRSGTTILFEAFARHPDLAWPSSYCRMWPQQLWLNGLRRLLDNRVVKLYSRKQQYGRNRVLNDYFPQPDEAYPFWEAYAGNNFARDCLHNQSCSEQNIKKIKRAVTLVVEWQGRHRFAAKLTGPPRIAYLRSIFPDAQFVHVVRDGRAVVHSLLNVAFWRDKGGLTKPFWDGCLAADDLEAWEESGNDPGVLAALEWRRIIEITREEAADLSPGQYWEVQYEEYMSSPHDVLTKLCERLSLADSKVVHSYIEQGAPLRNMNHKFQQDFTPQYLSMLERYLQPALGWMGY